MSFKKISTPELKNMILETIEDLKTADEIEAVQDAWSGGANLELDVDHSKAVKSEPVTDSQEILDIKTQTVVRISENRLRKIIREFIN